MATEQRSNPNQQRNTVGVFLGKVVSHLDTTFMGGLQVEILRRSTSGSFAGETVNCKYASPFYGQTPYSGSSRNSDYASTQKSYGFWAVPPDIGTQVLVLMPEGDFSNAYWVGCVPDVGMNFMTPGNAATTYNTADPSIAIAVGEYNKRSDNVDGKDVTQIEKPVDLDRRDKLRDAGLLEDHIRGSNTSSARREAPSMVFGISTPGPHDLDGPTHSYGPTPGTSINAPFNRLGGSSFVMDDGDMSLFRKKPAGGDEAGPLEYANLERGDRSGNTKIPANELIRLRTRNGHQILLHNSEDLIYISHGSGKSWIEMSANGKIDIYAEDSISVNTDNDLNFNAGRDINFSAKEDINIIADKNIKMHSLENTTMKIDQDYKISVDENMLVTVNKDRKTFVKNNDSLKTDNDLTFSVAGNTSLRTEFQLDLQQKELNSQSTTDTNFSAQTFSFVGDKWMARIFQAAGIRAGRIEFNSNGNINTYAQGTLGLGGNNIRASRPITQGSVTANTPSYKRANLKFTNAEKPDDFEDADAAFYPKRIPQHEPWKEHENLDPLTYIPDETRSEETDRPEPDESEFKFPTIPDTFKK